MIQPHDFEVIREFDLAKTPDEKRELLNKRGDEVRKFLFSFMKVEKTFITVAQFLLT